MPSTGTPTRRSAPKVRSGCSTCKARHLRCDERRPRCGPCKKSFRLCEYSTSAITPYREQLKVVIWEPHGSMLKGLSTSPDHSLDESQSFDFFRSKIASDLGGFYDSSFWTQDVLQAARREPAIHHAVVALASVSKHMLMPEQRSWHRREQRTVSTLAISQQTKAIAMLKKRVLSRNEPSVATVLIACVLFICIDMYRHTHGVLRHMTSGLYLFFDWFTKRQTCFREAASRPTGSFDKLTQQLHGIFGRLMLQTVLFIETTPRDWQFLKPEFTPPMPSIPRRFDSIEEARHCLDGILESTYHGEMALLYGGLNTYAPAKAPGVSRPSTISGLIHQWQSSFDALTASHKDAFTPRERVQILLLNIQRLTGTITSNAGVFNPETVFDGFEHEFSQIVTLAGQIIGILKCEQSRGQAVAFPAFDMGILPPLYYTASRCRHPKIRREALGLLRKGPRQEGIWHRSILASIAERIMKIEEKDCPGAETSADVPVSSRISVLNANVRPAEHVAVLHCCQRREGETGAVKVLHELIKF